MSWLDQLAEHVEELRRAGVLQQNGRSAEALPILDGVLDVSADPTTRAYALVQRFGALINLGRVAELSTAMTLAANTVREIPDPYLRGQMHAFAALGAHLQRNLDRGVTH
ncbi:MAG: GGDEF domain-containing protein, partial [Actinoplanes sp.]